MPVFGNGSQCWRCKEEDLMRARGGVVGFDLFAGWGGGGGGGGVLDVTGSVETLSGL